MAQRRYWAKVSTILSGQVYRLTRSSLLEYVNGQVLIEKTGPQGYGYKVKCRSTGSLCQGAKDPYNTVISLCRLEGRGGMPEFAANLPSLAIFRFSFHPGSATKQD